MDRLIRGFRRQSPLEEIIEENSKDGTPGSEATAEAAVLPDGYKLIEVVQPDGSVVAVRRKLATWQLAHRDSLMSSRTPSSRISFRAVTDLTTDDQLAHIRQPVQDVAPPSGIPSRLSQARSAGKTASVSSSIYSVRPERDTVTSTMTMVDTALAEQASSQSKRHSRRDGSEITTTGTAISGTSGDIHIGHIEEAHEYDNDSDYASSDFDDGLDNRSECGQTLHGPARSGYRKCTHLISPFSRAFR